MLLSLASEVIRGLTAEGFVHFECWLKVCRIVATDRTECGIWASRKCVVLLQQTERSAAFGLAEAQISCDLWMKNLQLQPALFGVDLCCRIRSHVCFCLYRQRISCNSCCYPCDLQINFFIFCTASAGFLTPYHMLCTSGLYFITEAAEIVARGENCGTVIVCPPGIALHRVQM